jgi:hypothetical protein
VRLTKCGSKQTKDSSVTKTVCFLNKGLAPLAVRHPSSKQNKKCRSAIGRSGAHRRKLRTTFCLSANFGLE